MCAPFTPILSLLPGKSGRDHTRMWLPTWLHALDTAGVMKRLLLHWLPQSVREGLSQELGEDGAVSFAVLLALLHDIGKMTPLFVSRIAGSLPEIVDRLSSAGLEVPDIKSFRDSAKSPHALAGAAILSDAGFPEVAVQVVFAHHGQTMTENESDTFDIITELYKQHYFDYKNGNEKIWRAIHSEWIRFSLDYAGYSCQDELPKNVDIKTQVILSGLVVMADWIASNTEYFPLIFTDETGSLSMCEQRACDGWNRIRLPYPWSSASFVMDSSDFEERFGFLPNAVQSAVLSAVCESASPGIMILEAQMGVGKTEAALAAAEVFSARFAEGGIFFGLPTQATANGIFPRLLEWARLQSEDCRHAIRLAHGMSEMNEDYRSLFKGDSCTEEDSDSGLVVHSWFKGRKQALLSNFVIGTVDQLLLCSLKQRHLMLRHIGIAGKVVVVDECHAYDAFMNQYLECAISWLGAYGVPVILLSATLPPARRRALVSAYLGDGAQSLYDGWESTEAYPLLTWTDGKCVKSRAIEQNTASRTVKITGMTDDDIASFLFCRLECGGCAGIIVNTVSRAQKIGSMLKEALPDYRVMIVHSHFLMTDRAEWEKKLLSELGKSSSFESRNRLIVVGTQVLEQSLDIDFDIMITDLCPMDLLLQRIGRLHRHPWRKRPEPLNASECGVLYAGETETESGASTIYGEWLLKRTRSILPPHIKLPEDIAPLVHKAYSEPEDKNDSDYSLYLQTIKDKEVRAKNFRIKKPSSGDSLIGWLATSQEGDERHMEASVRDGDMSVEVLIMVDYGNGYLGFVAGGEPISASCTPDEETARRIAQQRLRLPYIFTYKIGEVIKALEETTSVNLYAWQESAWLRGELVLLIGADGFASLAGYRLHYDSNKGLTYRKEDDYAEN